MRASVPLTHYLALTASFSTLTKLRHLATKRSAFFSGCGRENGAIFRRRRRVISSETRSFTTRPVSFNNVLGLFFSDFVLRLKNQVFCFRSSVVESGVVSVGPHTSIHDFSLFFSPGFSPSPNFRREWIWIEHIMNGPIFMNTPPDSPDTVN